MKFEESHELHLQFERHQKKIRQIRQELDNLCGEFANDPLRQDEILHENSGYNKEYRALNAKIAEEQHKGDKVVEAIQNLLFPQIVIDAAQASFVGDDGQNCPSCGCPQIEGDSFDTEANLVLQHTHCTECDAYWRSIYKLTGFENLEEG